MHVRGSDNKELINLNQELVVFLQHADDIYSWT